MLINLQILKQRHEFAMLFFVNDIISIRIDSSALLSQLSFNTPSRHLRTRKLFSEKHCRANYAKNGPINRMMCQYNQHCKTIGITMSEKKRN